MQIKLFHICVLLILLFIISSTICGKCRREAEVKYKTSVGWSKWYSVEPIFLTGFELNKATKTFNYNSTSNYCVIFWANNEATIIKIKTLLLCGIELDCNCLANTILDLEGLDQEGDEWKICLNDFCF